jgi:hypothetical protein
MFKVKTGISQRVSIGKTLLVKKLVIPTILISLFFSDGLYADARFNINLDNEGLVNDNTYEFDVVIKSNDEAFTLTSYQASFVFNQEVINGGDISFSYIEGTSELSNVPSVGIGLNLKDGIPKLTFASLPGEDLINSNYIKIGRFRLHNTNSFSDLPAIRFSFDGRITTILTGSNFVDITNLSNHTENFGNFVQYEVIGVTATGTPAPNNTPEKTIDGLGYYDGDPNARWAAQPMPQRITFDLGSEVPVSMTKFSFYNFQEGRIYQYTIALSNDQVNWSEVVVNASSASEEWTVNQFVPQLARYVKLVFISSTNNPNNWANLWEAQILGEEESFTTELSSYTGFVDSNDVVLNWITSSEMNNSGFEVERQTNDADFEVIGFVEGNGTTSEANNYSFTDEDLPAGKYSYRLKQMDFEGSYNYSDTLDFEISNIVDINELGNVINAYQLYQNYPNPFNPQTTIRFDIKEENFVNLSIYNVLGEKVKELVNDVLPSGSHEVKFDGSELSSGIYIYRLDVKEEYSENKKMSLLK